MGNIIEYGVPKLRPDSLATIRHTKYTRDFELAPETIHVGKTVKVIQSGNMLKSRPGAKDICISECLVMNPDKTTKKEVFLTESLNAK